MPTPWKKTAIGGGSFHQLIVGVNLLVFLAMVGSGISLMGPNTAQMIHWGGNYGPLTLGGQSWRLFTYMFLHYGIIHFGLNMWCLWNLGALAESLYGDWLYALVYVLCGLGGGLLSLAWHPSGVSAGASGAVFGVAGALIGSLKLGEFSLPPGMIQGTLKSVITFAGYNLVFGAMSGRTDNACHVGGFVTGLVLGAAVALLAPQRDQLLPRLTILVSVFALLFGGFRWVDHKRGYVIAAAHGSALLEQGKPDEAIPQLKKALENQPNNAALHYELAHAYQMKSHFAEAESELIRVIFLAPTNNAARNNLGYCYLSEKKYPNAVKTFQDVLASDPKDAYAHNGLGWIAFQEGNHQSAVAELETAVELDPKEGDYYSLGVSYTKLKRHDEAIATFKRGQEIYGDYKELELGLAEAYRAKGMKKEAEEATTKASQLKDD